MKGRKGELQRRNEEEIMASLTRRGSRKGEKYNRDIRGQISNKKRNKERGREVDEKGRMD